MPENIRALVYILIVAAPAFYLGRKVAGSAVADREFKLWRNAWIAVTVVALVSLNILVCWAAIIAVCVFAISARVASVGLFFVLLFALPLSSRILLGGAGIVNKLIDLTHANILIIFLLLPILIASRKRVGRAANVYTFPDWLVVGYVLLQSLLVFRDSDFTNVMRVALTYFLNVVVPYFAFSRSITSVADVRKVYLAFIIAALPIALISVFELVRNWHIYGSLQFVWGGPVIYLRRAGLLRAMVTSGNSIVLGFVLMVAFGCVLAVWNKAKPRFREIILVTIGLGLFASLSRGPWVGCAALLLVFLATGPNAVSNVGKIALLGVAGLALVLLMPGFERLMDLLPFVGKVDEQNITYRQQLFENSMEVIARNPLFGTPDFRATQEMLEMAQGEGIIDIVNTYLEIAMKSGLAGAGLFIGIFVSILFGLRRAQKFHSVSDPDYNSYVRASMAIIIGIMITIATVSSLDFIPYVFWPFAGIGVAIVRVGYKERAAARLVPSRVPG